ncbi:hypothetical protein ACVIIV_003925 [Bradyrhizobium sp. USDA 4354]
MEAISRLFQAGIPSAPAFPPIPGAAATPLLRILRQILNLAGGADHDGCTAQRRFSRLLAFFSRVLSGKLRKGAAMRTFGIWVFGLLASAIFGGLIGDRLYTGIGTDGGFFGILAGAFAFACMRLWLGQPRQNSS